MYHAGMDGRNRADEPDPFADYIEWAEHRYDPGYYLGGNPPPHLRSGTLGPHARKRAAVLIAIMSFTMFGGSLLAFAGNSPWEFTVAAGLTMIGLAAAVRMYRAPR